MPVLWPEKAGLNYCYHLLMVDQPTISVLFVCMGNICRSPTAEGVFRKVVEAAGLADVIRIDSAGTHS